jgi:hypothetical protein
MTESIALRTIIQDRYYVLRVLRPLEFGWLYSVVDRGRSALRNRSSAQANQNFSLYCLEEFIVPEHLVGHVDRLAEQVNFEVRQLREFADRFATGEMPEYGEVFAEGDRLFLKQFFVEHFSYGQVLEDRVLTGEGEAVLSEAEAWELLDGVEPLLKSLHSQGLSHGNLSPESLVWLVQEQKPGLMHFGGVRSVLQRVGVRTIHDLGFEASLLSCPIQTDWTNLAESILVLMGDPNWNHLSLQLAQRLRSLLETTPQYQLPIFNRPFQTTHQQITNHSIPNNQATNQTTNQATNQTVQNHQIPRQSVPRPPEINRSPTRRSASNPIQRPVMSIRRYFKTLPSIKQDPVLWILCWVIVGLMGLFGYRMIRASQPNSSDTTGTSPFGTATIAPNSNSSHSSNSLPNLSTEIAADPTVNLPTDIKTQLQQLQVPEHWFALTIDELLGQSGISPEDSRWKDNAKNLIQALEKLNLESRQGIGSYRRSDFDSWLTKANKPAKSVEAQTDQQFFVLFPDRKGKPLNPRQLGQVWYAMARSGVDR